MPVRVTEYYRPPKQADALALLRRTQVSTGPLFIGPRPDAMGFGQHQALVDLSRLNLSYIDESTDGLIRIGAMTPLQDLVTSPLLQSQAGGLLSRAARQTAHSGLRHLATLGGVALSTRGPLDVIVGLLALDATLVLQDEEPRPHRLFEFVASGSKLPPGQYPVEVHFAKQPASGVGASMERVARTRQDEPIVATAAWLHREGRAIRTGRLVVAGAGIPPQRLAAAEQLLVAAIFNATLVGRVVEAVKSSVHPAPDYRASAAYQRDMAGTLAGRALSAAWAQGGSEQ